MEFSKIQNIFRKEGMDATIDYLSTVLVREGNTQRVYMRGKSDSEFYPLDTNSNVNYLSPQITHLIDQYPWDVEYFEPLKSTEICLRGQICTIYSEDEEDDEEDNEFAVERGKIEVACQTENPSDAGERDLEKKVLYVSLVKFKYDDIDLRATKVCGISTTLDNAQIYLHRYINDRRQGLISDIEGMVVRITTDTIYVADLWYSDDACTLTLPETMLTPEEENTTIYVAMIHKDECHSTVCGISMSINGAKTILRKYLDCRDDLDVEAGPVHRTNEETGIVVTTMGMYNNGLWDEAQSRTTTEQLLIDLTSSLF